MGFDHLLAICWPDPPSRQRHKVAQPRPVTDATARRLVSVLAELGHFLAGVGHERRWFSLELDTLFLGCSPPCVAILNGRQAAVPKPTPSPCCPVTRKQVGPLPTNLARSAALPVESARC
jgi:hypothetical protein